MQKLKTGSVFQDRYLILKELGTGGMGAVYQAKQLDADRIVALKIFRCDLDDEEAQARFRREFKLLASLSHPQIVTVYGMGLADNSRPYAVCEYIDGDALSVLIRQGPLSWQRAASIALQISDAMSYAHACGVVHRDLKPDNVMILSKPQADSVKLLDFGLSRLLGLGKDGQEKLTLTGQLLGTPDYFAPELLRAPADQRSDIYSLACVLYEMLAARTLFPADEAVGVIYRHANEDISASLRLIKSELPESMLHLLSSMLKKDPQQRPESMESVSKSLKAILADPGTICSSDSALAAPSIKKKNFGIYAFAVLLAGLFFAFYFFNKENRLLKNNTGAVLKKAGAGPEESIARHNPDRYDLLLLRRIGAEHRFLHPKAAVLKDQDAFNKMEKLLLDANGVLKRARKASVKAAALACSGAIYGDLALKDPANRERSYECYLEAMKLFKVEDGKYLDQVFLQASLARVEMELSKMDAAKEHLLANLSLIDRFRLQSDKGFELPRFCDHAALPFAGLDFFEAVSKSLLSEVYYSEAEYDKSAELALFGAISGERGGLLDGAVSDYCRYADCLLRLNRKSEAVRVLKEFGQRLQPPQLTASTDKDLDAVNLAQYIFVQKQLRKWFIANHEPEPAKEIESLIEKYSMTSTGKN